MPPLEKFKKFMRKNLEVCIYISTSVKPQAINPVMEEIGKQLLENLESNLPDGVLDALHNALSDRTS